MELDPHGALRLCTEPEAGPAGYGIMNMLPVLGAESSHAKYTTILCKILKIGEIKKNAE